MIDCSESLQLDNPLWQFALASYGKPGIAELCLQLQASHNVNVNLLLLSAYLQQQKRDLSNSTWVELFAELEPWQNLTERIRRIRVELKPSAPGSTQSLSCYKQVKRLEFVSEQYQQAIMWRYAACAQESLGDVTAVVERYGLQSFNRQLRRLVIS